MGGGGEHGKVSLMLIDGHFCIRVNFRVIFYKNSTIIKPLLRAKF